MICKLHSLSCLKQSLSEALILKGLWAKLFQPFGELRSSQTNGSTHFATALTWLSSACAGHVLGMSRTQGQQGQHKTDEDHDAHKMMMELRAFLSLLVSEVKRCYEVSFVVPIMELMHIETCYFSLFYHQIMLIGCHNVPTQYLSYYVAKFT